MEQNFPIKLKRFYGFYNKRYEFQSIVHKYKGDYRTKEFKCWNQLACMLFAHIRQEDSLRDIEIALNAHASKLYHIRIKQYPKSTLADANERWDYRIYSENGHSTFRLQNNFQFD